MIKIDKNLKMEFERFCRENYPGIDYESNRNNDEQWFNLEAGNNFQSWIHYEFYDGQVQLHLEQPDDFSIVDINLLNTFIKNLNLSNKLVSGTFKFGKLWALTTEKEIETEDDLFAAFVEIKNIIEPILEQYEELIKARQNGVAASIKSVNSLLQLNLVIPDFQRPYEWTSKNVQQLLDDVNNSLTEGKDSYRIGSIILFYNEETKKFEIVDGQQRLTTILLILQAFNNQDFLSLIDKLEFRHSISFKNIKDNYKYLEDWKKQSLQQTNFIDYLINKCEFVQIIVTNLSEAFQMFDSQNGRGKPLEAYNLLKAYHLRAMDCSSQDEKIEADKRWESAVRYKDSYDKDYKEVIDLLKCLFNEQLYRSRKWTKYPGAGRFSKDAIDEFKGYTIDKNTNISFPFQNPQLLQYITSKFYQSVLSGTINMKGRLNNGDPSNINPFSNINQEILNGKPFFDYIETYVEIYKILFIDLKGFQLKEFKKFYSTYCINYEGSNRKGDKYLLELYKALVFVLFDKFGEDALNMFYKNIYALVYKKRLIHKQIKYETVDNNNGFPHKYFFGIQNAKNISDLSFLKEDNCIKKSEILFREPNDDDDEKKKFTEDDVFYTFFLKENLIKDGQIK